MGRFRQFANVWFLLGKGPQASSPITIGCISTLFSLNRVFRTGSDLRRWSTHTEVSTRIIEQARYDGEVYTLFPVHCRLPRPTNGRHLSRVYLLGCPQSPNSAFFFRKVTFQCIDI